MFEIVIMVQKLGKSKMGYKKLVDFAKWWNVVNTTKNEVDYNLWGVYLKDLQYA